MIEEDDDFQASSEDIEIKPWDLPYWSGGPKETKKDTAKKEPEIEENVEVVEPLTVEALEAIRNEGYEEGFLQGLNEGRDKGEKEGLAAGKVEGHKEGHKAGQQEGNRIGFEAGQAEGLTSGKDEISEAASNLAKLTQQLEQSLVEKDSALPQVLSQLIRTACETIIERELEDGDNHITKKVVAALAQLPSGAENIQIYVGTSDAVHLEHGLSNSGREMHFNIDDSLAAGSARITTKQSLIEFSLRERMDKVFELIDQECEKLDLSDIDGEPLVAAEVEAEEYVTEEIAAEEVAGEEVAGEEVVAEEDVTEEDVTEEDVTEEDVTEEIAAEEVAGEEVAGEEVVAEEDVTEEDVTEEDVTEEIAAEEVAGEDVTEEDVTEEDVTEEDVTEEDVTEENVTEEDVTEEVEAVEAEEAEEAVVEETIIEESPAKKDGSL
jgi:flagellar assembly protein FliH